MGEDRAVPCALLFLVFRRFQLFLLRFYMQKRMLLRLFWHREYTQASPMILFRRVRASNSVKLRIFSIYTFLIRQMSTLCLFLQAPSHAYIFYIVRHSCRLHLVFCRKMKEIRKETLNFVILCKLINSNSPLFGYNSL